MLKDTMYPLWTNTIFWEGWGWIKYYDGEVLERFIHKLFLLYKMLRDRTIQRTVLQIRHCTQKQIGKNMNASVLKRTSLQKRILIECFIKKLMYRYVIVFLGSKIFVEKFILKAPFSMKSTFYTTLYIILFTVFI